MTEMEKRMILANGNCLQIKLLHADATLPSRGSDAAIGYDCYAYLPNHPEGMRIPPGKIKIVPLGFAMKPPPGVYGRLAPRSGLAVKGGIDVLAGVIDADYRGQVQVVIINHNDEVFLVRHGMKVCQLILEQARIVPVVSMDDLDTTDRGSGGFGSTGA